MQCGVFFARSVRHGVPAVITTIFFGCLFAAGAHAQYQWTAIPLHPDGAYNSTALAAAGGVQAGTIGFSGQAGRAALWNSSANDWIDLTPDWASGAFLNGMDGDMQAGQVQTRQGQKLFYRAALWQSTADSAVILHPAEGYRASEAKAIAGNMQVGNAKYTQTALPHAALWYGTAESFVDLNPAGADKSRALATDGTLQGGWAALPGGGDHEAVIWSGTPESVVNLAPEGALASQVNAMAPGVQVGNYRYQGENRRAALWRGTAESMLDLSPTGSVASELYGTDGSVYVGAAAFSGFDGAGIWLSDDPDSYINLHQYLPPEFYVSLATDVFVDGSTIYVTGIASDGPNKAWLWVGTIPSPGTLSVVGGGLLLLSKSRQRR